MPRVKLIVRGLALAVLVPAALVALSSAGVAQAAAGSVTVSAGVTSISMDLRTSVGFASTVSYAERTAPVTVRLDNLDNDGQAGEGDDVRLVENVVGGAGNDSLVGDAAANGLSGGVAGLTTSRDRHRHEFHTTGRDLLK